MDRNYFGIETECELCVSDGKQNIPSTIKNCALTGEHLEFAIVFQSKVDPSIFIKYQIVDAKTGAGMLSFKRTLQEVSIMRTNLEVSIPVDSYEFAANKLRVRGSVIDSICPSGEIRKIGFIKQHRCKFEIAKTNIVGSVDCVQLFGINGQTLRNDFCILELETSSTNPDDLDTLTDYCHSLASSPNYSVSDMTKLQQLSKLVL
jgi:hypothetical protein